MNKTKRTIFNFFLGAVTCVLLISFSITPAPSKIAPTAAVQNEEIATFTFPSEQPVLVENPINQHLMADLQAAESVLMAQGAPDSSLQRYAAILTSKNVVPQGPSTYATGVAGAVLVGDRLVVRGDFSGLSSPLRDYATDPVSPPNPNITSAVHVHQGEPKQNGPFQYALTVALNDTGLGGRFTGDYTLTAEQLQALSSGKLYVDIHTQQNRAGELRGIFQPI